MKVINDNILLQYQANQEPCNTYLVGTTFDSSNYAIGLQKNSSITDSAFVSVLNLAIVSLRQSGVLETLYDSWWNVGACGTPADTTDSHSIDVESFYGVFALVGIVSGFGILILSVETGIYFLYKKYPSSFLLGNIDTFFGGKSQEQSREIAMSRAENFKSSGSSDRVERI